jgi:HPt (histidine-containing phosphotransfer) domain-containing protein
VSDPNPLDPQVLEQLQMLETERPGLMKELIRLFVADAPKQMRLIDGAYGRRDPELLRQSAHFLRSGSLALGLNALAARAHHFEHLPLDQYGSKDNDAGVVQLRAEVHRVLLALLKMMKDGGAA